MKKITIIHKPTSEKPFLVINKPKGLASAPLSPDDKNNALAQAMELYPQIKNVKGRKEIEYGLLHRLDTVTDGLLLIATSQAAYDFLQKEQREGRFMKTYQALCDYDKTAKIPDGFPPVPAFFSEKFIPKTGKTFSVSSYFRYFRKGNKEVRPVTKDSGKTALEKVGKLKEYTTEIFIKDQIGKNFLVECSIKEGFKHQVRCHLAWCGLPIVNDSVYGYCNDGYDNGKSQNSDCDSDCDYENILDKKNAEKETKFSATKIQFEYPKGDLNSYEITFTWT